MSGINMATTDDVKGAKAYTDRKFGEANAYTDEQVAELEKKLEATNRRNDGLQRQFRVLQDAFAALSKKVDESHTA